MQFLLGNKPDRKKPFDDRTHFQGALVAKNKM